MEDELMNLESLVGLHSEHRSVVSPPHAIIGCLHYASETCSSLISIFNTIKPTSGYVMSDELEEWVCSSNDALAMRMGESAWLDSVNHDSPND